MSKLSRRDFLKVTTVGAGAITLGSILDACGQILPGSQSLGTTSTSTSQNTIPAPISPTNTIQSQTDTALAPSNTPVPLPYLVVNKGGEPEPLVRQAIAALGGIERFVPRGANVVVKPNICVAYHTYEYAATTNPWLVGALVKMAYEAGAATVKVMDSPFGGTQKDAYEISGIKEQVEAAGGTMVNMLSYKYVQTSIPSASILKNTAVYDDILKADVLINVPIAKQHGSSRLTLGMKNLMGVIKDRNYLHVALDRCIADLNRLIKPQLTVLDAIRILTANGPTGGDLNDVLKLDTVVVSPDVVATDSYATSFFDLKPEDIGYIVEGTGMGLGRSDLQNLNIRVLQQGV